ncbi:MAG: hypothetical protein AABY15_05400 [Nanoarchaeota archaeon]
MNVREIIQEEIRKILSENYPLGAAQDPSAPWNQVDNIKQGDVAENIIYSLIWTDSSEFAVFKDAQGNKYLFYLGAVDKSDLEPYADREEEYMGRDEDGDPIVDYGEWEITDDVVENYVNDNLSSLQIGKGLSDYENGFDLIMIDEELRMDLMDLTRFFKDENRKAGFINAISGAQVSESGVTDKIVNKKTMDTPTGTLFIMDFGASGE